MSDVNDVFNIAVDVLGEDNVDLQINNIIIHWDKIVITNENDSTHDIFNLYAKVGVSPMGRYGCVGLIRSTFTKDEALSGYVHSHVVRAQDGYVKFETPCFGTGPIKNTMTSLARDYDEDLWRLFFVELDRFVRVESLTGVPYIRMGSIVARQSNPYRLNVFFNVNVNMFPLIMFENINKVFNYMRDNNRIVPLLRSLDPVSLGSINDAVINMTRESMMYHNANPMSELEIPYVYCAADIDEGSIIIGDSRHPDCEIHDMETFYFKGEKVTLRIIDDDGNDEHGITVLDSGAASALLSLIVDDVYKNYDEYLKRYNEYNKNRQQSGISACAAQG